MSVFHVEAVLKERPELWGILGKRMIGRLRYAGVKRINAGMMSGRGSYTPYYIISHDGLLLARVENNTLREMFSWIFETKTVLDAVRRVGAVNVSYIAQFDEGCDDADAPCALYIYKTPKEQTLATMVEEMQQKAQSQLQRA